MPNSWRNLLSKEQVAKIDKIVSKIPGLGEFLAQNDGIDFILIIKNFENSLRAKCLMDSTIQTNIDFVSQRFSQFLKLNPSTEASNTQSIRIASFYRMSPILSWQTRPRWACEMTDEEIMYLSNFIVQITGLLDFIKEHPESENLYDLAIEFKKEKQEYQESFILSAIQYNFYKIMEGHTDAIHYVNHMRELMDGSKLDDFNKDIKAIHYNTSIKEKEFRYFLEKHINADNPYINNWIFKFLFRNNDIDLALYSVRYVLQHTFSSPNKYWDNKESVYGCADSLYFLVDSIGGKGLDQLKAYDENLFFIILESLYHLFSRIIYWTDKETDNREYYSNDLMPINVQHKLRAYRLRSNLVKNFGHYFRENYSQSDLETMCISDLSLAHKKAEINGIVGENSLYKQEAYLIYNGGQLKDKYTFEDCSSKGLELTDNLSQKVHKKYLQGKYCLDFAQLMKLLRFFSIYLHQEGLDAQVHHHPISYLKKDNFSPELKTEKAAIEEHLQDHGVQYFYHFTEREKLFSIKQNGGLMSSRRCLDEGIVLPITTDIKYSRDKDAELGLDNYARLSFCKHLPLMDIRKKQGKDLVLLKIDTKVALFKDTRFTDIEATYPNMKHGTQYVDLQNVDIEITKKDISQVTETEKPFYQAEVLVKGLVPLKYIVNIDNPISL